MFAIPPSPSLGKVRPTLEYHLDACRSIVGNLALPPLGGIQTLQIKYYACSSAWRKSTVTLPFHSEHWISSFSSAFIETNSFLSIYWLDHCKPRWPSFLSRNFPSFVFVFEAYRFYIPATLVRQWSSEKKRSPNVFEFLSPIKLQIPKSCIATFLFQKLSHCLACLYLKYPESILQFLYEQSVFHCESKSLKPSVWDAGTRPRSPLIAKRQPLAIISRR